MLLVATSTDVWVLISEAVSSVRVRVVTRTGGLSVTDTTLNQKNGEVVAVKLYNMTHR